MEGLEASKPVGNVFFLFSFKSFLILALNFISIDVQIYIHKKKMEIEKRKGRS